MKIAAIATSQVPSNTANSIQVMKTCQSLAQLGHAVTLWVPGTTATVWERLAHHYGLTAAFTVNWVSEQRRWRRYDFAWKSLRQARARGADLIYTWLPQVALLALLHGLPAVLELHDRPTGRLGPWLVRAFAAHPGKKRLLVITRALQDRLHSEFGVHIKPDEVVIAPNAVELERYQNLPAPDAARRDLGLPDGLLAVYTGHFYAGRGTGLLVELARALPEIRFLWVGGNPRDVEYWRMRLMELGLHNILLTGFVENTRLPLYQAAGDVLLMPYERAIAGSSGGNSADICSPMKMFDYLAAGRAILTSDLPVLHEVLNPDNAVFCPPEDVSAWTQALSALAADPEQRARLAARARQDAAQYTWRARAQRTLAGFLE